MDQFNLLSKNTETKYNEDYYQLQKSSNKKKMQANDYQEVIMSDENSFSYYDVGGNSSTKPQQIHKKNNNRLKSMRKNISIHLRSEQSPPKLLQDVNSVV